MKKPNHLQHLCQQLFEDNKRATAPLMGLPGVTTSGYSIKMAGQNYQVQTKALTYLADRFQPDVLFPIMDLSSEANALGLYTHFPLDETPTVPKRTYSMDFIDQLEHKDILADGRVLSTLKVIDQLYRAYKDQITVGGYITGPYTLAALILGAEEAAMQSMTDPGHLKTVIRKIMPSLLAYGNAQIDAGARVICILEPSAALLAPDQFKQFSLDYVDQICNTLNNRQIPCLLHVCGNTTPLLPVIAQSAADGFSLDSEATGLNWEKVVQLIPESKVLLGNINPTGAILKGDRAALSKEINRVLMQTERRRNFILSTGCDLPPNTPLEMIDHFMETGRDYCLPSNINKG
jgi:uroporphyrinogen decarboxylase